MLTISQPDPAPITRQLRAMYGSRLLLAAVHHLHVFELLSTGPLSLAELSSRLGLAERPAMVLFPALCAMELLGYDEQGRLSLSPFGRYLTQEQTPNL
ncbi:MAG TPA: methyltransferase, partial [Fibrella sp.]